MNKTKNYFTVINHRSSVLLGQNIGISMFKCDSVLLNKALFSILILVIVSVFYYFKVYVDSIFFLITNAVISIFCIISLILRTNTPYSLYTMFFLFSLFFYGLVPALEVTQNVSYWGGSNLNISSYNYTNSMIILCLIIYQIFYFCFFGNNRIKAKDVMRYEFQKIKSPQEQLTIFCILFTIISIVGVTILWYNNFDAFSMFFRGGELANRVSLEGTTWLLYHYFIKPIPAVCVFIFILLYGVNRYSLLLLLSLIFFTSPTSMARFQAAVIYIPIFLVTFTALRKEFFFPSSIMVSLLVVFPLLDKFRHYSTDYTINLDINYDFLLAGHFDSYQNFVRVFELDLITHGWQLLGSIFFFVPRSIWSDKPIGSGHYLADVSNLNLSNISLNFLGEGYINFGLVGVIAFTIIIAVFSALYDRKFWKTKHKQSITSVNIFYFFLLGLIFFLLRGDLMSSFAYSVGMFCSTFIITRVVVSARKWLNNSSLYED